MTKVVVAIIFSSLCAPAYAQLGGLLDKAKKVQEQKQKLEEFAVTDEEERRIGEDVSDKIRARFGVVQDPGVHKYVTLVGLSVARASERPRIPWTFVVLDTDGVNAFAAPGGIVHITRGALGLIRSEAELAGVLAHEVGHVAHKHAVNAIRKSKVVQLGTQATTANRSKVLDADRASVAYTQQAGYSAGTLADFLTRLDERNKEQPARNGLFASHPETKERIDKVRAIAGSTRGANGEARYKQHIKYTAVPITAIAAVEAGASGLTGSTAAADDKSKDKDKDKKGEAPKKGGFGLGALKQTVAPEKQSAQVTASGGSRGVGPDRAAKGGGNPALVKVPAISDAELAAFQKALA
jgi:predicted Zn-dependent protease